MAKKEPSLCLSLPPHQLPHLQPDLKFTVSQLQQGGKGASRITKPASPLSTIWLSGLI